MAAVACLGLRLTRRGREFGAFDMLTSQSKNAIPTPFNFEDACASSQDDADADDYLLDDINNDAYQSHDQPTLQPTPTTEPSSRAQKNKAYNKRRRKLKEPHPYQQAERSTRHVASSEPVETVLETDDLPHPVTSYIGPHKPQYRKSGRKIPHLGSTGPECLKTGRELGYTLVSLKPGDSKPFCDTQGRVWGIAVRRLPNQIPSRSILSLLINVRTSCTIPQRTDRGPFDAHAFGFSYGGGQKRPLNFRNSKRNRTVLRSTFNQPQLKNLLAFGNGILTSWFPRLHGYYTQSLATLTVRLPHLQQPSNSIPFGAFTFNVSRQSICGVHRDSCNYATGLCFDEAFGNFDWTQGGHLVLHEAQLIIEMSPGTMVFFPSAVITHQVIPIQPHEERLSLTGYTAGGLFRFMDQGFSTAAKGKLKKEGRAKQAAEGAERWKQGLKRFMTIDELLTHHAPATAMYGHG